MSVSFDDIDFLRRIQCVDDEHNLEVTPLPEDVLDLQTQIAKINSDLNYFANKLKIAHINARSVPKHIDEIRRLLLNTNFDLFLYTLRWNQ